MSPFVPDRGQIVWLDFDPQAGREPAARRPAFVLSPERYNRAVGLALFCPVTSRVKGYPFEMLLPDGLGVSGVVLADQVRSLDGRRRRAEFAADAPAGVTEAVRQKVLVLLR